MEKKESKRDELFGLQDKWQITAVFAGFMSSSFLPPQIIYQGKTSRCLPTTSFPKGWSITYSKNHIGQMNQLWKCILKLCCSGVV